MRIWLTIAGVVLLIDQITKQLAEAMLSFGESVAVMPFFNITLAYNTGAAFSFLAQAGGWQRWFFAALALTVSAVIFVWLRRLKPQEKWSGVALALILGGALGNVIDRILFGHVIDFLDVYYTADQCMALFSFEPLAEGMRCHWPAFNIADSAISVGAVMMVIDSLRGGKKAAA
ncbi:MAG: signal peptidase II [Pseudomonadota bacterium]